jgi:hypothetical protein
MYNKEKKMVNEKFSEAIKRFECKDYEKAIDLLKSISEKHVLSMYYLGAMYRIGFGVKEDQKEAFKWFLKAAKLGHVESQFLVGCAYTGNDFLIDCETELVKCDRKLLYSNWLQDTSVWQDSLPFFELSGVGTEPNDAEAFKWIFRAAEQGYVRAQVVLADMYDWGNHVEEDKEKAILWYEKAASNQNTEAMRKLGALLYENKSDINKRIEWLKKAFDLGDQRAAFVLGKVYERDIREEGHIKQAIHWYKIGAEKHNCFESQIKLGDFALQGIGQIEDITQAVYWYKKAIKTYNLTRNDSYYGPAYDRLFDLYGKGYKDLISENEYLEYLKVAVNYSDDSARIALREYYKKGYDVGEQNKKFFELLDRADQGDKDAQIKFGYLYVVDKFLDETSVRRVKDWFLDDAVNGDVDAQYLIAHVYNSYTSQQEHHYWLKKAADQGHSAAQYKFGIENKDENPSDYIEYIKLASKSNVYAQIELGYNYAHGQYVCKSYLDAYNLYQKAADNMKKIEDIRELRIINNIKIRYNAANDEAEQLALNDDVDAQLYMGCLYQYGFEIKRNKEKAVYWYELANTNGSVEASEQLIIIDNEMI